MAEDTVKMKAKQDERPEKLSYEQLENVARQLSQQNEQLAMRLDQSRISYIFTMLDYMMRIVEHPDCYALEFVEYCKKEVANKIYQMTKEVQNGTDGTSQATDTGSTD